MSEPETPRRHSPEERLTALEKLRTALRDWNRNPWYGDTEEVYRAGNVVECVTTVIREPWKPGGVEPVGEGSRVRLGVDAVTAAFGGSVPPRLEAPLVDFAEAVGAALKNRAKFPEAENTRKGLLTRVDAEIRAMEVEIAKVFIAKAEGVPIYADPGRLTPVQEQIVGFIRQAGRRLTTAEILTALEQTNGAASVGTTKQNLAELTRRGILTNARDAYGRGYGLPAFQEP
jgi:hypothetical protein